MSRTLSLPESGEKDRFGAAAGVVGLDGDGCNDLVMGAPGVDGVGAVYPIFSTAAGTGTGARVRSGCRMPGQLMHEKGTDSEPASVASRCQVIPFPAR